MSGTIHAIFALRVVLRVSAGAFVIRLTRPRGFGILARPSLVSRSPCPSTRRHDRRLHNYKLRPGRRGRAEGSHIMAPGPRYQEVARELIASIRHGSYQIGDLLPTEIQLAREFRVSRATMREALRKLREAGLISRTRHVGTRVIARVPADDYRQPTNSIRDLLEYAENTRVETFATKRILCEPLLARELESRVGRTWLRIDSLRRIPETSHPICMTTSYLDGRLPNLEKHLENIAGPISAMLEGVYGLRIVRIEQSIQAIALGRREAKRLESDVGSPALLATRRYYADNARLIELSRAIHPSDRFTYTTTLVRD